jgi:hypothetical protein
MSSSSGDEDFERVKKLSSQLRGLRFHPHHHQQQDEQEASRPHDAGAAGGGRGDGRPPPRPPRRGERGESVDDLVREVRDAKEEVVHAERLLQEQLLARLAMRKVETRLLGDIARTRRERAEFAMAMAWRLGALRASAAARKVGEIALGVRSLRTCPRGGGGCVCVCVCVCARARARV